MRNWTGNDGENLMDNLNLPTDCIGYTISLNISNQNIHNLWFSYISQNKHWSHRKFNTYGVLVKPTGQNLPTFRKMIIPSLSGSSNTFIGLFHPEGESTNILRNGTIYQSTQRNIPEDLNIQHLCENLSGLFTNIMPCPCHAHAMPMARPCRSPAMPCR